MKGNLMGPPTYCFFPLFLRVTVVVVVGGVIERVGGRGECKFIILLPFQHPIISEGLLPCEFKLQNK